MKSQTDVPFPVSHDLTWCSWATILFFIIVSVVVVVVIIRRRWCCRRRRQSYETIQMSHLLARETDY